MSEDPRGLWRSGGGDGGVGDLVGGKWRGGRRGDALGEGRDERELPLGEEGEGGEEPRGWWWR